MPVEHETKFILADDCTELLAKLETNYVRQSIHQIYLTKHNRFREITKHSKKVTRTSWYHTFKKRIDNEILEIESEISGDDFQMVCKSENLGELYKIRYTIKQKVGQWDIDFLLTAPHGEGGTIYFACCECEQPKGLPIIVPKILNKFIRWEVPYEHSSIFSNFKLSKRKYAETVIDQNIGLLRAWAG